MHMHMYFKLKKNEKFVSTERSLLHKVLTFDFTLYVIDSSICYRDLWLNIIYFHVQVRHYLSLFTNKCIGIMLKDGDGVNPCFIYDLPNIANKTFEVISHFFFILQQKMVDLKSSTNTNDLWCHRCFVFIIIIIHL